MLYLSPALTVYILILTVILGAVMGSFATCMAGRIATGESFLRGRSHCADCRHVLGVKDLIPVFSWLALKGRCRWCGAKIPVRCLVMELLCAAAFTGLTLRYGVTLQTVQYLIFTVVLLSLSLVDYDTGLLPDKLLLVIFIDWIVFTPFLGGKIWVTLGSGLLGGLTAFVPLLLLTLVMDRVLGRESMGGGDLKLFFVTGLFFSWQEVIFLLIVSCVFGILFAKISQKTTEDPENPKAFPFGPAIAAGAYFSLLIAGPAVTAYLSLF